MCEPKRSLGLAARAGRRCASKNYRLIVQMEYEEAECRTNSR